MKLVKKTAEHKFCQRRDGRYAVTDAQGKPVNGEEKTRLLLAEGLISVTPPAPADTAEPEPEAEAAGEEPAGD